MFGSRQLDGLLAVIPLPFFILVYCPKRSCSLCSPLGFKKMALGKLLLSLRVEGQVGTKPWTLLPRLTLCASFHAALQSFVSSCAACLVLCILKSSNLACTTPSGRSVAPLVTLFVEVPCELLLYPALLPSVIPSSQMWNERFCNPDLPRK